MMVLYASKSPAIINEFFPSLSSRFSGGFRKDSLGKCHESLYLFPKIAEMAMLYKKYPSLSRGLLDEIAAFLYAESKTLLQKEW